MIMQHNAVQCSPIFHGKEGVVGSVRLRASFPPRRESRMVLAAGAVKIRILLVAIVVFILVYGFLTDFLQRRGP
jgi:hypothetical protein